jgi:hypothetical protein
MDLPDISNFVTVAGGVAAEGELPDLVDFLPAPPSRAGRLKGSVLEKDPITIPTVRRKGKAGPWAWYPKRLIGDMRRVGHAGVLVYVFLAQFTRNGVEEAFPSQDAIARGLRMSKSTIRRALSRLSGAGYVKWRYTSGRNRRGRLIYTLLDPT